VEAEVGVAGQRPEHSTRQGADPDLDGVAVLDQRGDQLADSAVGRVGLARGRRAQRAVGLDRGREGGQRQAGGTSGPRHLAVDLGDQRGRVAQCVGDVLHPDPERHQAVVAGHGDLQQPDVARQQAAGEHPRQRRVVAGHHLEAAPPAELAQQAQTAVGQQDQVRGQRASQPFVPGQPGESAHRADGAGLVEQGVDQRLGLRAALPPPDAVTGADVPGQVQHRQALSRAAARGWPCRGRRRSTW
jgi:hypothetical protein